MQRQHQRAEHPAVSPGAQQAAVLADLLGSGPPDRLLMSRCCDLRACVRDRQSAEIRCQPNGGALAAGIASQ